MITIAYRTLARCDAPNVMANVTERSRAMSYSGHGIQCEGASGDVHGYAFHHEAVNNLTCR